MEPLAAGDPRQVGGYRLRARPGAGGMGQVFGGPVESQIAAAGRTVYLGSNDGKVYALRA